MPDKAEFEAAAENLPAMLNGPNQIEEHDLLYLYGRYKQVTVGHCKTPKPGFLYMSAQRKWHAWNDLGDMSCDTAMQEYIDRIKALCPSWRYDPDIAINRSGMGITVSTMRDKTEKPIEDCDKTVFDWCKEGALLKVQQLFNDPSLSDQEGRSLLHWACDRGHLDIVKFLVDNKHALNCGDSEKSTPLHYASACGHVAIVTYLLERGADATARDGDGETPLDCATSPNVRDSFVISLPDDSQVRGTTDASVNLRSLGESDCS